ncbi:MAG: endonuclease V [Polyangiaceae bacterium]|nr:endonuclease V [Polyangiaceae bacterium]
MIACVDVHYGEGDGAIAAAVTFDRWDAASPVERCVLPIAHVEPYEPGAFYKRELPCIVAVLDRLAAYPTVVVVDGHAWLEPGRPGLGARLLDTQERIRTVVGVAKTRFHGAPAVAVLRGGSAVPLWVDEAGEPVDAPRRIAEMHGPFRLPTMLKLVDRLGRSPEEIAS